MFAIKFSIEKRIKNFWMLYFFTRDKCNCLQQLLSTLLIQSKLVYGRFGLNNMHSTLDLCPRPARKETNAPLHKRNKELTVLIYIMCKGLSTDHLASSYSLDTMETAVSPGLRLKYTNRSGESLAYQVGFQNKQYRRSKELQKFNIYKMHSNFNLKFQ